MKKIGNCAYCGDSVELPFECNFCKDPFCAEHRLPENHRCVKLTALRARKFGEKHIIRDKGIGRQGFLKKFFNRFKD
ncbi:MAG: nucleotide-binding protein [Marine Group I thaumarchaeote]|nr:MAG: nucleotide-binding protein [Marine Group I thaumarchaeote]